MIGFGNLGNRHILFVYPRREVYLPAGFFLQSLYPYSLADLYDEITMPSELRKVHQANSKAVMPAYGFDYKSMTEIECMV